MHGAMDIYVGFPGSSVDGNGLGNVTIERWHPSLGSSLDFRFHGFGMMGIRGLGF